MKVRSRLSSAVTLLTASALSACADPPLLYGDQPRASSTDEIPPPPDLATEAYPEAPAGGYGVRIGDTLFDIDLKGYRLTLDQRDSSALALEGHLTLSSVRQANPHAKCIWLQMDAFW